MTLICFASQKGSPGATAAALAVAASLKLKGGRRKVLLEADTTGGTLAIRYRLPVEPGLLTLAAAVRGGLENSEGLWRHAQELPGGLPVIVCPDGPEQVHAAMAAGGAQLGRFLNGLRDVDVMCDVGRLSPDSPALPFVAEASAVLMVARPTAEQLQPAARRMLMLRPLVSNLGWVLVGQKPYGPADVEATYEFPVVGVMADDPRSVQLLERGTVSKRLRRQPFIRSATTLAETLSGWLSPLTSTGAADLSAPVATEVDETSSAETAPVAEAPQIPTNADLSLLPPPAGEPDTVTPSPLVDESAEIQDSTAEAAETLGDTGVTVEDTGETIGDVEEAVLDTGETGHDPEETLGDVEEAVVDILGEEYPAELLDEVSEVSQDWDPPVVPEPPLAPTLASAPFVSTPDLDRQGQNPEMPSEETDPFPTEHMRPVPPPPAPNGSRPEPDPVQESVVFSDAPGTEQHPVEAGTNGFAALAEPTGLGWDDLEPVLPSPAAPPLPPPSNRTAPPLPPESSQNGAPERNGSPPVPPSALLLNPAPSLLADSPKPPPPALMIDGDQEDDWDGSEFTVTADLTHVFAAPDFDAPSIEEPRTEPPMPPMASVPPLPPASTQLEVDAGEDRQSPPSPFPNEDSGVDWTGW